MAGKGDAAATPADGAGKKGLIGTVTALAFGTRTRLMISAGALVVLIGGGAAGYFLFAGEKAKEQELADASAAQPIVAPTVAFYDVPEIIVNIQPADGTPAYLKLGISLELASAEEKTGLQAVMPRVVDQFQAYLRELRMDDLKGSAGVLRLKEELLRRINVAAAPYRVRDVLLKEMIVQ